MNSEQRPNFGRLFLLIAAIWFVVNSLNSRPAPEPVPEPEPAPPAIVSEIETANNEQTTALSRHVRDVIEKLERGELTDERETRDLLAAGVKAARDAAWQPIKDRDVTAFADGWTVEKQVQRLRQLIGD